MYGLTPAPVLGSARELGLTPAMSLSARLAHVKAVPAGTQVSYGSTWTAGRATTLGLVPVGYADGIPRSASSSAEVAVAGRRARIAGRVAMDQFVVDLAGARPNAGDLVRLFGSGEHGEPTADEWAEAAGTIGYEIVTRVGPRVPRRHHGGGGAG
jgi:alanine racemase